MAVPGALILFRFLQLIVLYGTYVLLDNIPFLLYKILAGMITLKLSNQYETYNIKYH